MQNVQNADIQEVMNLVNLYRTKVGKESQIAKAAKDDFDFWLQLNLNRAIESIEGSAYGEVYGEGSHTEEWIEHLSVNEQLLGHFYVEVAGENAEQDVLDQLLPDVYDKTIFTEEEENFLKSHFKEMVNYIIQTPCNDSLKWVHSIGDIDNKDTNTIPNEVLELISSRVHITSGSNVYYPYTMFAQLANLFKGCTFYVDTMFYAWTRVAIYANSINAKRMDDTMSQVYDAIVACYPYSLYGDGSSKKFITRICDAYNNLPSGGKLILLCSSKLLADSSYREFREMMVKGEAIKEIIQLPQVMSKYYGPSTTHCILVAEKGRKEKETTLIDARTACNDTDTKNFTHSFDMAKFNAILKNDGKDPNTGLRKVVKVSAKDLSQHVLIPEVYTVERPSETENPVRLSSLCAIESQLVRDVQFDLPEDTPCVSKDDLTPLFTGDLDMSEVRAANCPNNPQFVEGSKDYCFDNGVFSDNILDQMYTKKGLAVLFYRESTFLEGNADAVLYNYSSEHGVCVAVVRATGQPYAASDIIVFHPKAGVDANTLAAILRMPIVYRQIEAYHKYGIESHLDEIFVPTDKRVIGDELFRMKREENVAKELGDRVQTMKTEYINEVRMRKHDMRPHMRQLNSAKKLMQYYVDNMDTVDDVKQNLNHQLVRFRDALAHISYLIENLSDEEKFGKPERFSLTEYFKRIESESIHNGENLSFRVDFDACKKKINDSSEHMKEQLLFFVNIAPLDFDRLVQNIIENARKHGFTDSTRDDYMICINLSADEKRDMYIIDFMNNGTPLPEGMTKARYGIKGEKAGLTCGTGSGGYIVKSIVNHYGGDYDVFSKEGITTVRIYLPKATI